MGVEGVVSELSPDERTGKGRQLLLLVDDGIEILSRSEDGRMDEVVGRHLIRGVVTNEIEDEGVLSIIVRGRWSPRSESLAGRGAVERGLSSVE